VANGGDIGGAGTFIDSGTNQGGKGGGCRPWGENGAKGKTNPETSHPRPKKLLEQDENHDTIAKSLGVSRRTLYRGIATTLINDTL